MAVDADRATIPDGDYTALYSLARKVREVYPAYPKYRNLVWEAVTMEKASMDQADASAWYRVGNRIMYFLDDAYQAGICFKAAVRIDPSNADARQKLRELGYVYYRGRWWLAGELGGSEVFEKARRLEDLAEKGQVAVGMSREQVVRAWGLPEAANASGGGWGVTVQWVYTLGGHARYVDMIADTVVSSGELPAERGS